MKSIKKLFTRKPSKKVVAQKMEDARNSFIYSFGIAFTILMLFLSTTVNAQVKKFTTPQPQKISASMMANSVQGLVGIDFGGFEYSEIRADGNTLVFVMRFTNPVIATQIDSATPEDLRKLSLIFKKSITGNPQTLNAMVSNNINMRIVIKGATRVIFDETIYAYNL